MRTPGRGPINGIIEDGEAQVLEVNPNLVCSPRHRQTADHTGFSIKTKPPKDSPAFLSLWINSAQPNFEGNNKDRLLADYLLLGELALYTANVLFFKLLQSRINKKK